VLEEIVDLVDREAEIVSQSCSACIGRLPRYPLRGGKQLTRYPFYTK